MGKLCLISLSGETFNLDYQSIAYIPQKVPEDLKKKTLHDYFLDTIDLDYSVLYRLAEELHFDSNRFASNQEIGSLSGEKLWKFSSSMS